MSATSMGGAAGESGGSDATGGEAASGGGGAISGASGKGGEDTPGVEATLSAQGGIVELREQARVVVPEDALDTPTTIGIELAQAELAPVLPETLTATTPVYAFLPHGLTFNRAVTVELLHASPADATVVELELWTAPEGGTWSMVEASADNGRLAAEMMHFSYFVAASSVQSEASDPCGDLWQACCPEDDMYETCYAVDTACHAAQCQPCGNQGEPCCDGACRDGSWCDLYSRDHPQSPVEPMCVLCGVITDDPYRLLQCCRDTEDDMPGPSGGMIGGTCLDGSRCIEPHADTPNFAWGGCCDPEHSPPFCPGAQPCEPCAG